ncbi:uncharacterized protein LOC134283561 [Saccostrea cucullata]|uniref:uncharacterized protein LOC134283561 n=1 Tax=Saccostrea cuccullata TaxID=36930 RepID=UPI002ED262A8
MSQWLIFVFSLIGVYNMIECKPSCEKEIDYKKRIIAMRELEENTCTWTIQAPENRGIWFRVTALRVSVHSKTCSSYLMLKEIHTEQRTTLKNYCSSITRDHVKTRHNQVQVSAYNVTFKLSWNVFVLGKANRRKDLNPTTQKYSQSTESIIEEDTVIDFLKENKYFVLAILAGIVTTTVITFTTIKICSKRRNQRACTVSRENYEMPNLPEQSDHNERHLQINEKCKSHQRDDYENIKTADFKKSKKEWTDIGRKSGRAAEAKENESSLEDWCSYSFSSSHKHVKDRITDHLYLLSQEDETVFNDDSHEYQSCRQVKIEYGHTSMQNKPYSSKKQNISPSVSSTSDCEDYVNLY